MSASSHDVFEEIPCATAKEFLEKLSPVAKPFFDAADGGWIYRGHGDADKWKLLPSARRPPTLLERGPCPGASKILAHQMVAEFMVVGRFYQLCHARGIPIPEDCFELRVTLTNQRWREGPRIPVPPSPEGIQSWPHPRLLPLVALAQHFRLPTCLLDWTRRSFVAAFFAATTSLELQRKKKDRSGKLCVWAFNLGALTALDDRRTLSPDDPLAMKGVPTGPGSTLIGNWELLPGPFSIVTPPGIGNDPMRAQDGLFLLHRPTVDETTPLASEPWEELIVKRAKSSGWDFGPVLMKLTLPESEAKQLSRYLDGLGITTSALFPGMHGIAQEIIDWLGLWDDDNKAV